jgi:hydroxypyruvate isomerase
MPRFAANVSTMFAEHDYLDRFRAAADAGFRAVECQNPYPWPAEAIAGRLADCGLRFALINMPAGDRASGELGLAALPGREEEFRESFRRAIAYARALACPRVHALAGVPPAGEDSRRARAAYLGNLRFAAAAARPHGIRVLIEPINGVDVPGYFLDGTGKALALLAEVRRRNVGLQYDVYHAHVMGEDPVEALRANLPRVAHVQVSGYPGRHEPRPGAIDFAAVFRLLDERGYAGWVGCEYRPERGTLDGLGWMRAHGFPGEPGPGG